MKENKETKIDAKEHKKISTKWESEEWLPYKINKQRPTSKETEISIEKRQI